MKQGASRRPVRVSLTLWYVGAMLVVLGVYASGVFVFVSRNLSHSLDAELLGDFEWAVEMAQQRPDGSLDWFQGGHTVGEDGPWLQVWTPSGRQLFQTRAASRQYVPGDAQFARDATGTIMVVPTPTGAYRILSGRATVADRPVILQVARAEWPMRQQLWMLGVIFVFGLPFGIGIAGIGGYVLAKRALAPVERMAERARLITAARLSDRLPVDHAQDELGQLASVFNETLTRLESAFGQMQRFTSDVSHELRTPLTAIRSVGEVSLRRHHDEDGYRGVISSMLEEADRLASLVDYLLSFSRTELGEQRLTFEKIDLGELASDVVAHLSVLAEEKHQRLTVEMASPANCLGDRVILKQALINLVDNAIKYTPIEGSIHVRVASSSGGALLEVTDDGPGIAPERQKLIFDRFYRANPAHTTAAGTGLGLSIARWAIEANGGKLKISSTIGSGCRFGVLLPAI
jgi:heavy metal sensor kinase